MKYLNRVLWVAIPLLMTSCLFPDDESIEESTIPETIIEEQAQAEQAQEEQMSPDLIGTWNTQSVDFSSVTTYTINGETTSDEVYGVGTELDYAITFIDSPSEASGEGIYSLELSDTDGNTQLSRGHNIISDAMWVYEDDILTLTSGGKIIEATVTTLSEENLEISITTVTTNTFNGVLTIKTTDTFYEFEKL